MQHYKMKGYPMKKLLMITALFLTMAVSGFASVGSIVAVKGDVTVERGTQVLKAVTGLKLEEKDALVSKAASKAQVLFNDKTVITIGKDSSFKISEYLFEAGQEPKASFNFAKGAFRTITGQIGKAAPDKFTLKSKTATIGIRGTQILGDVGQKPEDPIQIAFTDGHGFVQTPEGTVDIEAGQITKVEPGKPPTPPRAYKPAEINQMGQDSGGGGEKMEADAVIEAAADLGTDDSVPDADVEADVGDTGVPAVDTESFSELVDVLTETISDQADDKDAEEVVTGVDEVIDEVVDVTGLDQTPDLAEFVEHLNDQIVYFDESVPNDPYVSWGAWISGTADAASFTAADVVDGWVAGDMTPESTVAGYILNEKTATYTGEVMGIVKEGSATNFMENGSVNLAIDFGSAVNPVTGNIEFDANSEHWNLGVGSSAVQENGFTMNSFTTGANSDVTIGSGSGVGNFYGLNAESVGGKFSAGDGATVDESTKAAYGVFIGKQ